METQEESGAGDTYAVTCRDYAVTSLKKAIYNAPIL